MNVKTLLENLFIIFVIINVFIFNEKFNTLEEKCKQLEESIKSINKLEK